MIHELKTWPEYFQPVIDGTKTFEVRERNRPFAVGDTLVLLEWNMKTGDYTGRSVERLVTYILSDNAPGVPGGYVVMGIVDPIESKAPMLALEKAMQAERYPCDEHEHCGYVSSCEQCKMTASNFTQFWLQRAREQLQRDQAVSATVAECGP